MNAPVALALTAGMVAAVNPCGFSLLPAYLGYFVRGDDRAPAERRVVRAAESAALVTSGFVVVFVLFGLLLDTMLDSVREQLPWVTAVFGAVVVVLGAFAVAGRRISIPAVPLHRVGDQGPLGMIGFGVVYALASFSCTVGPFVGITAVALDRSLVGGIITFAAYGIGMGVVIASLAMASAMARPGITGRLRVLSRYAGRVGGMVMVLSGGYAIWYARWELAVYSGDLARDPIVEGGEKARLWVVDLLRNVGAVTLAAGVAASIVVATAVSRSRRPR